MATTTPDLSRRDLEARQQAIIEESSMWVVDILEQARATYRQYLEAYVVHVTEAGRHSRGLKSPRRPVNLHPALAKIVREEVLEQLTATQRQRRRAA